MNLDIVCGGSGFFSSHRPIRAYITFYACAIVRAIEFVLSE
jgi:hypothetical protein